MFASLIKVHVLKLIAMIFFTSNLIKFIFILHFVGKQYTSIVVYYKQLILFVNWVQIFHRKLPGFLLQLL